jgi:hypothetical protein
VESAAAVDRVFLTHRFACAPRYPRIVIPARAVLVR